MRKKYRSCLFCLQTSCRSLRLWELGCNPFVGNSNAFIYLQMDSITSFLTTSYLYIILCILYVCFRLPVRTLHYFCRVSFYTETLSLSSQKFFYNSNFQREVGLRSVIKSRRFKDIFVLVIEGVQRLRACTLFFFCRWTHLYSWNAGTLWNEANGGYRNFRSI